MMMVIISATYDDHDDNINNGYSNGNHIMM